MKKVKFSVPFQFSAALFLLVFLVSCAVSTKISSEPEEQIYDLKYSMAEGTKFTWITKGELTSITDQMGTEVVADIYGDAEDIFVVLAADKDKGLSIELEFGARSQSVDSMAGSDTTDFSELIGKKAKFILMPNGKVENLEGFEDLPVIMTASGEELNEDTYSLGMKATFPILPDRPVKIGDSWTDSQDMDIPSGGYILKSVSNFTYTLLEEVEKDGFDCLKIEMKGLSTISGDFEQAGTPLSLERETNLRGFYYFAYKEGMLISSESESQGEGLIHVPQAGIDIPQSITSSGTVSVKIEK